VVLAAGAWSPTLVGLGRPVLLEGMSMLSVH
jgi:hypothetical protein